MQVAVMGATGNVGGALARSLLATGNRVRALSRGGPGLDRLVDLGAEPHLGSFEDDGSVGSAFLDGADAVFTMVRSDWSRPDHYQRTAERIASALEAYGPPRVVNLSSVGAELDGAGHSSEFGHLEAALNAIDTPTTVHVRGGWFLENFLGHVRGVARHGVVVSLIGADVALPCVGLLDVAEAAAQEVLGEGEAVEGTREVQGREDLTTRQVVAVMGAALGRPVRAVQVSVEDPTVEHAFLAGGGTPAQWDYRTATAKAFNAGRVRFARPRTPFDLSSTKPADFVTRTWLPAYRAVEGEPSDGIGFQDWMGAYAASALEADQS